MKWYGGWRWQRGLKMEPSDFARLVTRIRALKKEAESKPQRCPSCGGPLTAMRPTGVSNVTVLGLVCEPCYEKTGEA